MRRKLKIITKKIKWMKMKFPWQEKFYLNLINNKKNFLTKCFVPIDMHTIWQYKKLMNTMKNGRSKKNQKENFLINFGTGKT